MILTGWDLIMQNPTWVPLAAYQPGTGAVTALSATNATPQTFYRIGVQLP